MSSTGTRAELLRRAGEAAARLAACAALDLHDRGRQAGLTLHSVDATVLALLRVHGPLTPRDLARYAGVGSSGTITGAIDRLERAGWTTRTPCQVDRRRVFITLTDVSPGEPPAGLTDALRACSDDELAAVCAVLESAGAARM